MKVLKVAIATLLLGSVLAIGQAADARGFCAGRMGALGGSGFGHFSDGLAGTSGGAFDHQAGFNRMGEGGGFFQSRFGGTGLGGGGALSQMRGSGNFSGLRTPGGGSVGPEAQHNLDEQGPFGRSATAQSAVNQNHPDYGLNNNPIDHNHPNYGWNGNHNWDNGNNNNIYRNTTTNNYSRTTDVNANGYGYGAVGHYGYPGYWGHGAVYGAPYPVYPVPFTTFPVGAVNLSLGGGSDNDNNNNPQPIIVEQTQAPASQTPVFADRSAYPYAAGSAQYAYGLAPNPVPQYAAGNSNVYSGTNATGAR